MQLLLDGVSREKSNELDNGIRWYIRGNASPRFANAIRWYIRE